MSSKQLIVISVIFISFGFAFGHSVGTDQQIKKYEELRGINNTLYKVIEKKDKSYDELMQQTIEYKWLYESCQTMFGDYQDRYELGD